MLEVLPFAALFLIIVALSIYGAWRLVADRLKRRPDILMSVADAVEGKLTLEDGEYGATQADHSPKESAMPTIRNSSAHFHNNIFVRSVVIAVLTLLMLIPLLFVQDMVHDRSRLYRSVIQDIAGLWGASQTISGPALAIPYTVAEKVQVTRKDEKGDTVTVPHTRYVVRVRVVLPSSLLVKAELRPQIRHRGIYTYVVYTSPLAVSGSFRLPTREAFGPDVTAVHWDRARFALGITDLRAITGVDALQWQSGLPAEGETVTPEPFAPGTELGNLLGPGFHSRVALNPLHAGQEESFSLSLTINGSGGLHVTPVAETTTIQIAGDWPNPSFSGNLLPTRREIGSAGFSAEWVIPHLSRTYPQSADFGTEPFTKESVVITRFKAGVDLFESVSLYTQVTRATKYGILFIGMTFIALLSFELITRRRMHLIQYAFVGIAMSLFYLVLLSLSEHTGFILAFAAAATVSVLMNGLYVIAALRSKGKGGVIMGLLAGLYLLLYALLRMEDYALLMGTAMVVVLVSVLMYLTRNLPAGEPRATAPIQEE